MAFGPDRDRPASEQVIKLSLKPGQVRSLPFSYNVPSGLQPGVYHLEYLLLEASGKALSSRAESAGSGFSIRRMIAVPPLIPRAKQPVSAFSAGLTVLPSLQQTGSRTTAGLVITPGPGAIAGQDLFVRVAGQEKFFKLGREKSALSFDIAPRDRKGPIPTSYTTPAAGSSIGAASPSWRGDQRASPSTWPPIFPARPQSCW